MAKNFKINLQNILDAENESKESIEKALIDK